MKTNIVPSECIYFDLLVWKKSRLYKFYAQQLDNFYCHFPKPYSWQYPRRNFNNCNFHLKGQVVVCRRVQLHQGIPMEETRNLFSVIKKNLQFAERSIFLHRVIYFGEHGFKFNDQSDSKLTLEYFMKQNVSAVNRSYCDEKLSGLLLCYANQFIHIVEGSEETLMRHLQNLTASISKGDTRFGVLKVLACVHHVKRRLFPEWSSRNCVPPVLIHDFESNIDNDMVGVFIRSCVWKLYGLAEYLSSRKQAGTPANQDLYELTPHLPEDTLLGFFLSNDIDALRDLREFAEKYGSVPADSHYQESIWPAMCDFVPYNPYDGEDENETSKKQ